MTLPGAFSGHVGPGLRLGGPGPGGLAAGHAAGHQRDGGASAVDHSELRSDLCAAGWPGRKPS